MPEAPRALPEPPHDDDAPQRSRLVWLLRAVFFTLLVIFSAILIVADSAAREGSWRLVTWWPLAVLGAVLFFAGVVAVDVLTPKRKLTTVSAVLLGLIAGVIITFILGLVMDLFADIYGLAGVRVLSPIKVMLGLGVCYLTVTTVLQTQDDFRLIIPYVEFAKQRRGTRPLLLDSAALIDGRILPLAETGALQAPIIIPRFVVEEMQRLSDSADRAKRARGRRGLDTVTRLQRSPRLDVKLDDTAMPAAPVDQMLVELARLLPAMIVTTDTGLVRIATIQNVPTINMHDLAAAVRPTVLPGEQVTIRLIRRGEQRGQAVGHLPDGTMVVAENAEDRVGEEVTLTVTGSVQTSGGRLVFARFGLADPRDAGESGEHALRGAGSESSLDSPDEAPPHDPATDAPGDDPRPGEPPYRGPLPPRRTLRNPRRG